jgi:hypothetical protein
LLGPAGNALSQRFERTFHVGILTRLLDGLLMHSYLLSNLASPRCAGQLQYRRARTIRQEMRRIGLPAQVRAGVRYEHSQGRTEREAPRGV